MHQSLTMIDYQRPIPSYYRKLFAQIDLLKARSSLLLPLTPSYEDNEHMLSVLKAYATCEAPMLAFQMREAKWHQLIGSIFTERVKTDGGRSLPVVDVFQNLLQLDLAFRGSAARLLVDNSPRQLRQFIKSCPRVQTLTLSFNEPMRRCSHDHRTASALAPLLKSGSSTKPLFPCLRSVLLGNATVSQDDLKRLLFIHAATLRTLRLGNIHLIQSEGNQDRKPCWVQIIKFIKSTLSLTRVEFCGWLSNGGRQKWFVSQNSTRSHRLHPAVQKYILDETEEVCPLDAVAVPPGQEDVDKPARGKDEFYGDWTWAMTYTASKHRHIADQLYSGSDFFSKDVPDETSPANGGKIKLKLHDSGTYSASDEYSASWDSAYGQPSSKKLKSTHNPYPILSPVGSWSTSSLNASASSASASLSGSSSSSLSSLGPGASATTSSQIQHTAWIASTPEGSVTTGTPAWSNSHYQPPASAPTEVFSNSMGLPSVDFGPQSYGTALYGETHSSMVPAFQSAVHDLDNWQIKVYPFKQTPKEVTQQVNFPTWNFQPGSQHGLAHKPYSVFEQSSIKSVAPGLYQGGNSMVSGLQWSATSSQASSKDQLAGSPSSSVLQQPIGFENPEAPSNADQLHQASQPDSHFPTKDDMMWW
jgi:hypothetical protein